MSLLTKRILDMRSLHSKNSNRIAFLPIPLDSLSRIYKHTHQALSIDTFTNYTRWLFLAVLTVCHLLLYFSCFVAAAAVVVFIYTVVVIFSPLPRLSRMYAHFRHHYRVVFFFSYFIFCLCSRAGIQFEWWFYAQSDFILSEVVLFCSFGYFFLSSFHFDDDQPAASACTSSSSSSSSWWCLYSSMFIGFCVWFAHMPDNDSFGHRLQAYERKKNNIISRSLLPICSEFSFCFFDFSQTATATTFYICVFRWINQPNAIFFLSAFFSSCLEFQLNHYICSSFAISETTEMKWK